MRDRAMQALYLLALDPVAETICDNNAYGFRIGRSTADAIEELFIILSQKKSAKWVLEGDIKGCFDNISHEWMLKNIPTDRRILEKWLKSGIIFNIVKYADDFIITGHSKELLEEEVMPVIKDFLKNVVWNYQKKRL